MTECNVAALSANKKRLVDLQTRVDLGTAEQGSQRLMANLAAMLELSRRRHQAYERKINEDQVILFPCML